MQLRRGAVEFCVLALLRDGLVTTFWQESESGPPRRYYQLIDAGRASLADFTRDWTRFRDWGRRAASDWRTAMTAWHTDPLVADYLRRLDAAIDRADPAVP